MKTRRRWFTRAAPFARTAIVALILAIAAAPAPAVAGPLDDAKAAGLIGERPDGFIGLVRSNAPADVRSLVDRINSERRASYADIARRNNTSAAQVGLLAGQKLINATPRGQYVMTEGGQWVTK